ncbi:MFS transporter [candidate division KSB1 bacterium]|nr:MFS transporter [candidate division KSB1 bacterium]
MRTERLGVLEKIGFGSGDAAVNVVWSAVTIILMYFYTDVYALNPGHIAWLMFLPRMIDAFSDVFMGMYTDSHTSSRGRYRPYFLIFAVPFGLAVFLMFTTPDFTYTGKLIYAYLTYILMILVFTVITIPYISLPGVLTPDPQERLSANGYRLFFAKVASLMVNIFVPVFAKNYAEQHGDSELARGYQIAMAVMAVMATVLFFFCYFTTKERVVHENVHHPFGQQFKLLIRNKQWLIIAFVCITGTMGYVLRGQVALYYAQYFLGGSAKMQAAFVTTGIIGNILSMVASTWITKKISKIQLFRWSQLITFVLSVLMYMLVKPEDVTTAFVFYFLINFIVDLQAPVFWSLISESLDYGQVKSGERVYGLGFGGISFAQKMGMSLAGAMGGMLLVYFKYMKPVEGVAQIQSDFTVNGLSLMLTIIPGIFHLIMGLLMFKYFITDEYYNENIRGLVTQEHMDGSEKVAV